MSLKNSSIFAKRVEKIARSVLREESLAVARLARKLPKEFARAVRLIADLPSGVRLVVSGIGKTGFIAEKIAASFASVGVPSFFLHPTEALHGDLGKLIRGDLLLLLSYSGETQEVIKILPHLKNLSIEVISITASARSSLGKASQVCLEIGKVKEAKPLAVAPTTSTTVMLALGDALMMSVLAERGFSKKDFAKFHPAGSLGSSLRKVSEVMRSLKEICVVEKNTLISEAVHKLCALKRRSGCIVVAEKKRKLFGILTDGDFRRLMNERAEIMSEKISKFCTKKPKAILFSKSIQEAIDLLRKFKIDEAPIVDNQGKIVGLVDSQDLLR
ncbi:MAG TPA: KpsF/GutQ family sugar-phosphate isomerase [Oligoflexia bacterium]|nr:KpsF/GutQ family sugar-phosphate isomerase [Oligoflexia bacterium]HMP26856.1 KpsF/GutQ family sugar-phosphate isomerase [Oligoflexia bacterium]